MSVESELIERVRELHKPVWLTAWHMVCEGCDDDSWESEQPEWPCRTALLVYTKAEQGAAATNSRMRSKYEPPVGAVLTADDPEPITFSRVEDARGVVWRLESDGGVPFWLEEGKEGDWESWWTVAGDYGPVRLLRYGS